LKESNVNECKVQNNENCYRVLVIGAGPAAIAAAIYCHRFDLKTAMIGQEYGGAIARTYLIENYPGFFNISGYELMEAFQKHYEYFKIPMVFETVMKVEKEIEAGHGFRVTVSDGTNYHGCALIIATGTRYRHLNVPGEDEFHGRGVSYCGTCDGPFFKDKNIIVVGGSDSAAVEALYLSRFGKQINIIYRRDKIRAEPINQHRCDNDPKIKIILNTQIKSINGKEKVESVTFQDGKVFPTDAVFIEIGAIPQSDIVKPLGVICNEQGEIIIDKHAKTNVPGLFAAGDVTDIREKQVATAVGWGVIASYSVREFLEQNFCV
jgi:thioredoxin reductase (NADPH)